LRIIRYMDKIMHFVASCSQSRGNFSDDKYLLGRQYTAAPSIRRPSVRPRHWDSLHWLCAAACPLCCSVASFVAVVIGAIAWLWMSIEYLGRAATYRRSLSRRIEVECPYEPVAGRAYLARLLPQRLQQRQPQRRTCTDQSRDAAEIFCPETQQAKMSIATINTSCIIVLQLLCVTDNRTAEQHHWPYVTLSIVALFRNKQPSSVYPGLKYTVDLNSNCGEYTPGTTDSENVKLYIHCGRWRNYDVTFEWLMLHQARCHRSSFLRVRDVA